jgi:hypothetical protein
MIKRDREVLEELRDDPELLAIADAVVETQRLRRRTPFGALTAVALAAAALFVLALVSPWDRGGEPPQRRSAETPRYSAEQFKRCIGSEHGDVIALVGRKGYTATSMMWPTFGEWVYFYGTAEAASAERVRLKSDTAPKSRVWRQLFRTQRSNTLVFAPAQKDWFSPIKGCLERARD